MGNSASHMESNPEFLGNQISLCEKRQQLLKNALKIRQDLAESQVKFNNCHKEVAEAIQTFIKKQTETPQANEDDENEITDNANEAALVLRQGHGVQFIDALRFVKNQFRNAFISGHDVSRKLETSSIVKSASSSQLRKLVRSVSRSFSKSSSRISCSTFYGSDTMGITLGELKRWEEKLCKELKDAKKAQPKSQKPPEDSRTENHTEVKTNSDCKVAKTSADFIRGQIRSLIEKRLIPKLGEQLKALEGDWKAMQVCHERQTRILSEVSKSPNQALRCEELHQQATKELQAQLCKWFNCLKSYVCLQKKYLESLCWYLYHSEQKITLENGNIPNGLNNNKEVTAVMKSFQKEIEALSKQQKKEHDYQKHEVRKLENSVVIKRSMINDVNEEQSLKEIENLELRIEKNKKTLQDKLKDTQKVVDHFQIEFSKVFGKLGDLSRNAADNYTELIRQLQVQGLV